MDDRIGARAAETDIDDAHRVGCVVGRPVDTGRDLTVGLRVGDVHLDGHDGGVPPERREQVAVVGGRRDRTGHSGAVTVRVGVAGRVVDPDGCDPGLVDAGDQVRRAEVAVSEIDAAVDDGDNDVAAPRRHRPRTRRVDRPEVPL